MIRLTDVSKLFRLYRRPSHRVLEWCGLGPKHEAFWALKDINLEIPKGRTFGIVGPNGAGKSTLLKLVTGTLAATSGEILVEGRVAALLELGTGFHPEFTGRQNIWINGQLLGLSPEEIRAREGEIVAFSELGPFIDHPLRTYSSGMIVRLGFSVAASVNPDVLIVDEALSVGDARFSQKCVRKIREFRDRGTTILFVSHDPGAVVSLCDEAVLIDAGRIVGRGRPERVLEQYTALLASRGQANVEMSVNYVKPGETGGPGDAPPRSGTFRALIARVGWYPEGAGAPTDSLVSGAPATLQVEVVFLTAVESPTVGILIRDRLGQDVFGTNTQRLGMELGEVAAGSRLVLGFACPVDLGPGEYSLTVAVHRDDTHLEECFDWTDRAMRFRVVADARNAHYGLVHLRPEVRVDRGPATEEQLGRALEGVFGGLPAEGFGAGDALSPTPFLRGVYGIERGADGRAFRWTEEEAWFVAPTGAANVGGSSRKIRLRLAAWGRAAEAGPVRLRLSAAARELGERQLGAGEEEEVSWELGGVGEGGGGVQVFRLQVGSTVPENPHSCSEGAAAPAEGRRLGVALLGVRLSR